MDKAQKWLSAVEIRERIARRECSAVVVTATCLDRIEQLDPHLRAFVSVDREGALKAAAALDAAQAAGEPCGPLHGVPVAVKDDLWVEEMPATCGSLLFADFRPSIDGTVAGRLRAAGAVIVGKTNMPEFAAWPRTKSRLVGESVNPWDTSRIPGASSGGSSAAVASGMVPVAIGTDGGGSVRIPASLTGLVGLFPTVGRIPGYGSFCCSPTESAGPMTRSVTDAAIVQQVIAGPDPRASHGIDSEAPDVLSGLEDGIEGLKVVWSDDFGWIDVDQGVLRQARSGLEALAAAGAIIAETGVRIGHPWGDASAMAGLHANVAAAGDPERPARSAPSMAGVEAWLTESSRTGELLFLFPQFQAFVAENMDLLAPPHAMTLRQPPVFAGGPSEEDLRTPVEGLFAEHDVICSPTMATIAPVAPDGWVSPYADCFMGTGYTFIANALRLPAITVPIGLVDGMPVGFQIIGKPGDEATILKVARAIEKRTSRMPYPEI